MPLLAASWGRAAWEGRLRRARAHHLYVHDGRVAHFWRKILGFLGSPCRNRELAVIAPNPGHGECSARHAVWAGPPAPLAWRRLSYRRSR